MEIIFVIIGMVLAGLITAVLAGVIWKKERPYGFGGDLLAASFTAIIVGLIDWYVIPAMGFSDTMKLVGVLIEPLLAALLVLWLMRRGKR